MSEENRSINVQNTIVCQMSKPGKKNSPVMLCKEALKRRVHKEGPVGTQEKDLEHHRSTLCPHPPYRRRPTTPLRP
jgi:hypothetical protein